jgi:hypothetical protein
MIFVGILSTKQDPTWLYFFEEKNDMWTLHVILIALTNSGITAIETHFTTPDFGIG